MTRDKGLQALPEQMIAMTVEEHLRAAQESLQHSDQEFEAGENQQGSEKLWGAASHSVLAVAKVRGWPFVESSSRRQAVGRLSEEYDDPLLVPGYIVAQHFHANFYNDFMEDDEIEADRPMVHRFVHRMLDLVEAQASHTEKAARQEIADTREDD